MRFDYAKREVDPLPGELGTQLIHEPIVVVRFIGPGGTYLIRGLLDTGASMTLVPRFYYHKPNGTFPAPVFGVEQTP